jgi:hypothetical protein
MFDAEWCNPHHTVLQNICGALIGPFCLLIIMLSFCGFEIHRYVTFVPGICLLVCWFDMGEYAGSAGEDGTVIECVGIFEYG